MFRACIAIALFVLIILFFIPNGMNDYQGITSFTTINYVIIGAAVLLMILAVLYSSKLVSSFQEAVSEVQKICTRKSNEDPLIAYSVGQSMSMCTFSIYGIYPLAIFVKTGETQGVSIGMGNQTGGPTIGTNTAQRLQELEGIKSMISNEEYEQKKLQILNSI